MDPNATLEAIRDAIKEIESTFVESAADEPWGAYERLLENVIALDGWISKGGFLPAAWVR